MKSPHIGVAYLAAALMRNGHDVKIVDADAEGLSLNEVEKCAAEYGPDIAGFTAMTYRIHDAAAAAEAVRRAAPRAITVCGGPHPSALPGETLREFHQFDATVFGEGEETISDIAGKNSIEELKGVAGCAVRLGNEIIVNDARGIIKELDALPFPAYEKFDLKNYLAFYSVKPGTVELPVSTARGCPFKCAFCSKVMGDRLRNRSIENVIDELKHGVEKFGASQFVMTDESFTFSSTRVKEFCEKYMEAGLHEKANWIVHSRVDMDVDVLRTMRRANCTHITFGLESGNQEILDKNVKKITLEKSIEAVRLSREAGMVTDGNFILGLPWETEKTIKDTISFAVKCDPDYVSFFLFVPYPGTVGWELAEKEQANLKLISRDWRDYGKQVGGAVELKDVPRKKLEMLQLRGYLRFYLRPSRVGLLFRKIKFKTVVEYMLNILKKR